MHSTATVLLATITAFLLAQMLKVVTYSLKKKKFYYQALLESGGLPSGHSAMMSGLTMSIYLFEGFSTAFTISLILSLIIMYDAMGVRRQTGKQGKALNIIIQKYKLKIPLNKEAVGHSPLEVFLGAILGIIVALSISML